METQELQQSLERANGSLLERMWDSLKELVGIEGEAAEGIQAMRDLTWEELQERQRQRDEQQAQSDTVTIEKWLGLTGVRQPLRPIGGGL